MIVSRRGRRASGPDSDCHHHMIRPHGRLHAVAHAAHWPQCGRSTSGPVGPARPGAHIWKNDQLGKSGYPRISQYKFSEMGYPRITWDKLGRLAYPGICKDKIFELTYLGISKYKNPKLA